MRHRGPAVGGSYPQADYYGGYGGGQAPAAAAAVPAQPGGGYNSGYGGGGAYGSSGDAYGYNSNSNSAAAANEDNKYAKATKKSKLNPLWYVCIATGLWALIMIKLWWSASGQYSGMLKTLEVRSTTEITEQINTWKRKINQANDEADQDNKKFEDNIKKTLAELTAQNRYLQKERDELRVKHEGPDKKEEESRIMMRDRAFREQLEFLQSAIKKESRRRVLEVYGPGPHKCQFFFQLDGQEYDFIVEMAPLDTVPHAVHLFLEQVAHGLWKHTYFYLNGPHVLQIGPQMVEEEQEEHEGSDDEDDATQPFQKAALAHLSFPDYNSTFPHTTWTLGYTGRPGGPDFYINKVNNTESHGPGGQYQHAIQEQGDSCFGKVTSGQQHLAKVFSQKIYGDKSEWHYFFQEPIEITHAVVLGTTQQQQTDPADNLKASQEQIQSINEKLKRKPRIPKMTAEP